MTVYFLLVGEPQASRFFFVVVQRRSNLVCVSLKAVIPFGAYTPGAEWLWQNSCFFLGSVVKSWGGGANSKLNLMSFRIISFHSILWDLISFHIHRRIHIWDILPCHLCVSYQQSQQSQHLDTAPVCATSSHGHLLGHLSVFHGVMEVCVESTEIMNQGPTRELAKQNQSVINDLGCSWQVFPTFVGREKNRFKARKNTLKIC